MLAVFIKELRSYFTSATGYIFMAVFLLISGIFFALSNLLPASPYYNSVLQSCIFVFLLLVPVITMKILAEETHQKTDQLLYTSPLKLSEIVIGKYFAAVTLFLITLLITCLYPLILSAFGDISGWEIVGNYIGFALMGSSFIAVGVFVSSLTESQVTSAVGTLGALLFIWLLDWLQQGIPTTITSGIVFAIVLALLMGLLVYYSTRNIFAGGIGVALGCIATASVYIIKKELFEGFTAKFMGGLSLLKRYDNFTMGILDVSAVVYYITFCTVFIFLTIRMIDKRRWS